MFEALYLGEGQISNAKHNEINGEDEMVVCRWFKD